ncbi:protein SCO1 homolog 2, mitochondrial isoform X3 [Ziziphus jujuba]|uniref:Protein SCO1 homolog 2, mitochondrial isoform X3 n=1 Tax=Ziziphus jujuba TaxID=326968 RepID=A0ABM3IUX0_ZIZJJ|nr:protein SCO1 homolog 2, mitochondrial isoform X3 [Ziziphus jujuba]
MPISRFLLSCSRRHSTEALNLLRSGICRFYPIGRPKEMQSVPSKRIQFHNYCKSSKKPNGRLGNDPVMAIETQTTPRSWGTYAIPAGAILGFVGLATFIHYNDERRVTLKGQGTSSSGNIVMGPIIGGPFTLVDTENWVVTEKNLLGNWVLLCFGYTSSPDVGPEQLQIMAKALEKLAQLRAYLKEFDPRILGLTGAVSAVRQMAQEYRVYFKKVEEEGDDYLVESSHMMYLMNPNMELARCFGVEYNADELSEAILKELKRNPIQ